MNTNILGLFLLLLTYSSNIFAWSLFPPSSFEECQEQSAKEAKSQMALRILINKCSSDFPARKMQDGKYAYYDSETNTNYEVSGPKMSSSDWKWIEESRNALRKNKLNQEAKQREALNKVSIEKWNWSCERILNSCLGEKHINATVKNTSSSTVSFLRVGWVFANGNLDCNGSLSETSSKSVNIKPNQRATVSFSTYDGPNSGRITGCLGVTGIQIE